MSVDVLAGFLFFAIGRNAAGESGTGELQFLNGEILFDKVRRGDVNGLESGSKAFSEKALWTCDERKGSEVSSETRSNEELQNKLFTLSSGETDRMEALTLCGGVIPW